MSRQTEHRKRRRAKGLCAREGCKETTGDTYYCPQHTTARKQYRHKRPKPVTPTEAAAA